MLLFNKKNIINESALDLRHYSPKALEKAEIINAALVIFPEHPSEELMMAYGNVKTKNIAATINVPDNRKIAGFKGATVLSKENITQGAIHIVNGLTVIKHIETDEPIEIIASGITIYSKNTNMNFLSQNGIIHGVPFEIEDAKIFSSDAKIDSLFIENLNDYTVVAAGNSIIIYNDVTIEMLKKKQIHFAAGNNIKCSYDILGYVQTIATAGNKIEVNE